MDKETKIITEDRNVSGFDGIIMSSICSVEFRQDENYSVRVEGPESLIKDVITEKDHSNNLIVDYRGSNQSWSKTFGSNGRVVIQNGGNSISFFGGNSRIFGGNTVVVNGKVISGEEEIINECITGEIKIYVTSPNLTYVKMSGIGDFTSEERIKTSTLRIKKSGTGNVCMSKKLKCNSLDIDASGTGNVYMKKVKASHVGVDLSGTGNVDMKLKHVENTDVNVSGCSRLDAFFDECDYVHCNASGMSNVYLDGTVRSLYHNHSGMSHISDNTTRISE